MNEQANELMCGTKFWIDELKNAGLTKQLPGFNDVVTGKKPQLGMSPQFTDVVLGGKKVDVYYLGNQRVYLYIKE